jgi:hypothetical protein
MTAELAEPGATRNVCRWTTAASSVLFLLAAISSTSVAQTQDSTQAQAGSDEFTPQVLPELHVARARGEIAIDGALDDPGWSGAVRATDFAVFFPDEGAKPPVASEVWITYDDENFYLAFLAYDDPSDIRASLRDRDESWQDDYFGFLLDTYGDASWAYFLFANPLGVQADTRFSTNAGEDESFDIIFEAEAQITDEGYQIEMAVPFKSLRFPNREIQTWRATFWRTWPRDSRSQHSWAAIDRDEPCFLCQFGTLTGMEGVKPGGALELLPAVVASQSGELSDPSDPNSQFENDNPTADLGLFVRYPFASGLTTEAAINPDFSQVESDAAQIDVNTTFALFFPERRPFFQEGIDLFDTNFNVVYTRQINDPIASGKLIGRVPGNTLAYLGAVDQNSPILLPFQERSYVNVGGQTVSNLLRYEHAFEGDSYAGAILTDRRWTGSAGGSGTTGGIDGRIRFGGNYSIEAQLLGSYTDEPNDTSLTVGVNDLTFADDNYTAAYDGESYWGNAGYVSLERDARTWIFDLDYWQSSPTFRADLGFENANDYRRAAMFQGLIFYPNSTWFDQVFPRIFARRQWGWDWEHREDVVSTGLNLAMRGDTHFNFEYNYSFERFRDIEFHNQWNWFFFVRSGFSEAFRPGFWVSHGDRIARFTDPPLPGIGTNAQVWFDLKPFTRWVIEPSVEYAELHDAATNEQFFSGYIVRLRTVFQFTRRLFVRLIVQYDDFSQAASIEPLVTYRINAFSVFYIGSTQALLYYEGPRSFQPSARQYFLKFQYLFRT